MTGLGRLRRIENRINVLTMEKCQDRFQIFVFIYVVMKNISLENT